MALTDKMVADGKTPWCIGLGSGGATGWPATDWIEDIMLRTQSPEDYDAWVNNDLKFNDPKVVEALELFGSIAKDDKKVAGGAAAVGTTDFRESPLGLFSVPPAATCITRRRSSRRSSPKARCWARMPTSSTSRPMPARISASRCSAPVRSPPSPRTSPAAHAFIDFLMNPISNEIWMAQSGFLSTLKAANVETYGNDTLKGEGEILLNATTFRFDGSDLMPGAIGAGASGPAWSISSAASPPRKSPTRSRPAGTRSNKAGCSSPDSARRRRVRPTRLRR